MAKIILESGETTGTPQVFDNHVMLFRKSGTGMDVDIEVADPSDATTTGDLSTIPSDSWVDSGTVLDDAGPIKPFFTAEGIAIRARVGTAGPVVIAGRLNEPSEYIRAGL